MKLLCLENPSDFLKCNEELLLKKESFYNLILGLGYSIRDEKIIAKEPLYYSVQDQDVIIGAAIRSNTNRPFAISEMPKTAVDLLVEDLSNKNIEIEGVVGPEECTTYFKDLWCARHGLKSKVVVHLGAYENKKLIKPESFKGEMILATEEHREIIVNFIRGFVDDCFPDNRDAYSDINALATRYLGNLYLLKSPEGEIISMTAISRGTPNGDNLSLVYTPPHLRGKGFASSIVGLLTEKVLAHKKFASLYTDLSNPTSNSIYQKLGYVKVGQNIHFDFITP